jgi:DNA polymerase III alpha subunit
MSEFPKHQSSEYVSKHKLSPEELKLAIKNSSKFLSAHTRVEMLHYFDQDPWIARQMAYYMKILDEENWEGKKMLEEVYDADRGTREIIDMAKKIEGNVRQLHYSTLPDHRNLC